MFWTKAFTIIICLLGQVSHTHRSETEGKGLTALELGTWDSVLHFPETAWKPVAAKEATVY